MNIASLLRHALTFLAGLGGLFFSWSIIAPDQVAAVNAAGADLIAPLTIILGAVAACVARLALSWIFKIFRHGSGDVTGAGGLSLWIGVMAAGGLCLALPSCSPETREVLKAFPIRTTVVTDYGTVGYSSKSGISVYVDRRSGK